MTAYCYICEKSAVVRRILGAEPLRIRPTHDPFASGPHEASIMLACDHRAKVIVSRATLRGFTGPHGPIALNTGQTATAPRRVANTIQEVGPDGVEVTAVSAAPDTLDPVVQ